MPEPGDRDELEPDETSADDVPEPEVYIEEVPADDPVALNHEVLIELRRLNLALERFNRKRRYIALSLTGGIARGFGAALGASLIFAIALALASRLITVPVVGEYVADVLQFVRQNSPAGIVMPNPEGLKPHPTETVEASETPSVSESLSPTPDPAKSPSSETSR